MKKRKKTMMIILCILFLLIIIALAISLGRGGDYYTKEGAYQKVTTAHSFKYCMEHPALDGIGQYVLPWENGIVTRVVPPLSLRYMCMCLGYDAQTVADGINFLVEMRAQENLFAYDFYNAAEREQNPHLETTKLFYIPGDPGAPFAMVIAGGGFTSVCMMQEAFPVAQKLHEEGYHVFMLKYRVGERPEDQLGTEKKERAYTDLGRAMKYIFDAAAQWDMTLENYSVWGFSAGARTTLAWTTNEEFGYQACGLPKPAMQAPIYIKPENIAIGDHIPATFMVMGTKDEFFGEDGCTACGEFCYELNNAGIPAVFEKYEGVNHGFGLGVGTAAEGWLDRAVDLWEEVIGESD